MIQNPVVNATSLSSHLNCVINQLKQNENAIHSPGLFHGQMGLAFFYYHLSRETNKPEYENNADELIDKIYEKLSSAKLPPDFENGLAGIGWGIEYLVQNGFLEADTDEILADVDDRVFQHVVFSENLPAGVGNGLLGFAIYTLYRLESCNDPLVSAIHKSLLVEIVNKITALVEKQQITLAEPAGFNLFWDLPALLIVLGKIHEKGIYTNKIYQLLKELAPLISSNIPLLHCNRAYFLWGLNAIDKIDNLPYYKAHSKLLAANISYSNIAGTEFTGNNISLAKGLSGFVFIVVECCPTFD